MLRNSRKSPRRVKEKSLGRNMSAIASLILIQMGFYGFVFVMLPHELPAQLQKAWGVGASFLFMLLAIFISRWFLVYKDIFKPSLRLSAQGTSALAAFALMLWLWTNPNIAPIQRIPEIKANMIPLIKSRKARHDVHKLTYYVIQKGISAEELAEIAQRFGVTETELAIFFDILKKQPLPPEKMKSTVLEDVLQQLITRYNKVSRQLLKFRTEYPEIKNLQTQAKTALDQGEFEQAEQLIRQIDEQASALTKQLAVTPETLNTFFEVLNAQGVLAQKMHTELQQIAERYHNNLKKLAQFKTDNASIKLAFDQASYFLEKGEFGKAEAVINRASAENVQNARVDDSKITADKQIVQAAEAKAQNADLNLVQQQQEKAASYLQQAAKILPREHVEQSVDYLQQAGKTLQTAGNIDAAKAVSEKTATIKENALEIDKLDKLTAEQLNELAKQLAVSPTLLKVFVLDVKRQSNLNEQVNDSLQRLASRYHDNMQKIAQFRTEYPDIVDYYPAIATVVKQASERVEQGEFLQSEGLLQQARNSLFDLAGHLGIDPNTLTTFVIVLKKQAIAPEKLEAQLYDFSRRYHEDLRQIKAGYSAHPDIKTLLNQAQQALQQAKFTDAENLIHQADERLLTLTKELKINQQLLETFLTILKNQSIADSQIHQHLQKIALHYRENIDQLTTFKTDDNEIKSTIELLLHALEQGEMDKADIFLNQISARNTVTAKNSQKMAAKQLADAENIALADDKARSLTAAKRLQEAAKNDLLAAAVAKAQNADLKLIQFKADRAARYFQEAADIVAKDFPDKAAEYLAKAQAAR